MSVEDLMSDDEPQVLPIDNHCIVVAESGHDLAPQFYSTSQVDQLKRHSNRVVFQMVHKQPSRQKVLLPATVPKLDTTVSAIAFHGGLDGTGSDSKPHSGCCSLALRKLFHRRLFH